jgi:hypothetical protein
MIRPNRILVPGALALSLCVSISTPISAEPSFELGVKAGPGITKLTGDDTKVALDYSDSEIDLVVTGNIEESEVRFVVGAFATAMFTDRLGVRVEALYFRKGGKGDLAGEVEIPDYGEFPLTGEMAMTLTYVEIPLLAVGSLSIGQRTTFEVFAGPALALKTSAEAEVKISVMGESSSEDVDIDDEIKGTDLGGVAGAGLTIDLQGAKVFVEGRWTRGFTKIDDTPEELDIRNNAIQFMAGVGIPFGGR